MIGEGIGSLLTGIGSLGAGIGALGSIGTGLLNYGNSTANLDYQKALQERIFEREDTALQRRMADAKAAGLNPYSVLQTGGASSGNVVKTEVPQLGGMNLNGILDTVNSILQIQQGISQTNKAKEEAKNALKTGLVLDADLTQKNWQNSILGINEYVTGMEAQNYLLDSLRHQAEFNYDFGTDFQFITDEQGRYTNHMYDTHSLRPSYYGMYDTNPWYSREFSYDSMTKHQARMLMQNSNLQNYWYENYATQEADWEHDVLKNQRELAEKENNWYNWNQGFNMLDRVVDDVTGILFKNLDLGIRREDSGYSNKLRNAQANYYNRRR